MFGHVEFLGFARDQLLVTLPYPDTSKFQGRTIIVTGSNVGLGFEAARHFARLGAAKVILAVRSIEKGNEAKRSIEESLSEGKGPTTSGTEDPHPKTIVEVWELDLASYSSVQKFAERASAQLDRLDVLLENAAIATEKYTIAEDNESTITVNVISTFLLALLLLPKLRETARRYPDPDPERRPHLVIVSSEVHYFTPFVEKEAPPGKILETLNDQTTANMSRERYCISKLLEVFFTRELAARAARSTSILSTDTSPNKSSTSTSASASNQDVIINFLNPGLCHSSLARSAGWRLMLFKAVFARSTEHGSRALVHAAGAGPESHGQYLTNCRIGEVAPLVRMDQDRDGGVLQTRVWDEIMERLERIVEGIGRKV